MKFVADLKPLLAEARAAASVAESKPGIDVLRYVRLTLDGNSLRLRSTDLQASLVSTVAVDGSADGDLGVVAKTFADALGSLDCDQAEVQLDMPYLRLKGGDARFRVPVWPKDMDDFPESAGGEMTALGELDGEAFVRLLRVAQFGVQVTKYREGGLRLVFAPGSMRVYAAGEHKGAVAKAAAPGIIGEAEFSLPIGMMDRLSNLSGPIQIAASPTSISFSGDGFTLSSQSIEAGIPNPDVVIAQEDREGPVGVITVAPLAAALKRAGLIGPDGIAGKVTNLELCDLAQVIVRGDLGDFREIVPIAWPGEELSLWAKTDFLSEALSIIGAKEVELSIYIDPLNGGPRALFLRPKSEEDIVLLLAASMPKGQKKGSEP